MKKLLCVILSVLLLVPFGTACLALNAGAADALRAEDSSNTARAEASVESSESAVITGKVNVPFAFNNDGRVILTQGEITVKIVNITADGTYTLSDIPVGNYNLTVSIPGWTEYSVKDITAGAGDDITIYHNTVIAGDVDHSGTVDIGDIAAACVSIGDTLSAQNIGADVDHDKTLALSDISLILADGNYGESGYTISFLNNGWSQTY